LLVTLAVLSSVLGVVAGELACIFHGPLVAKCLQYAKLESGQLQANAYPLMYSSVLPRTSACLAAGSAAHNFDGFTSGWLAA
jgi:hypothetical protein